MTSLTYRNAQPYQDGYTYRGLLDIHVDPDTSLDFEGCLNALAGTTGLGEDGAANVWNRQTHASAPYFACIGALNNLNGSYGLGLNLVCNELASTHGLSAQGALNVLLGNTP